MIVNLKCENENVLDSIVVAQTDKKTQNVLKAYIVVRNSPYEKIVEDLDKLCKIRFRKHVAPVEYIVVDNIPKTGAGKDDYRYVESFDSGNVEQVKMKVLYRKEVK